MPVGLRRASLALVTLAALLATVVSGIAQNPTPAKLPLVWVLSTGGTIAGKGASSTSFADYTPGSIRGEDLVASVPELKQVATIRVEQIANVSSSDITTAHWLTLARRIDEIFAADPAVAGVVITHGTNTLEETAYFLNLTVRHDRPVVVVGSMRPSTALGADGPLNLLNAVRTAIAPESKGKGVLVVLNDEINSARDVTKTNTYRVETFRSPELGLLGYVDDDKVNFYRLTNKRHTTASEFDVRALKTLPKVDILYSYVEPSVAAIRALVADGVRGIVFAGTGAGALSTVEREALKSVAALPADARPTLVRSNRTGNGRVIGGPVRRDQYQDLGMLAADNLNPQKARVLLMLALTKTRDPGDVQRMFDEY